MDKKIETEEDLTGNIASQNERELFHQVVPMKTSTDTVLLDADCDMIVKTEIKSETPFIKHPINQIMTDSATGSNNWEMHNETEIEHRTLFADCGSQNVGQFLPENLEMMDKEYNSDHEMCNKIKIKEEPGQLETETSSVGYYAKDVELPAVKFPRVSPETVVGAVIGKSPLISAELQARDTSLYEGVDHFEFEYQKCDVPEILTAKQDVHSTEYGKRNAEGDMYTQSFDSKLKSLDHVSKRPQQCTICAKTFTCLSDLKAHIHIHEAMKPHQCKLCDKSFTQLSVLRRHNLVHEDKRLYKCEVCDTSFTQSSHLNRHYLVHVDKKPYQCKVCDKGFTQLSNMKRHILVHERKKAHTCKVCDMRFADMSTLKNHNLVHEGKKPHKCQSCDKSFIRLSHLKSHNLSHEGKKPYKCQVCNKSFTRYSGLKTHNLIHEGKKPHKCQVCNKSFTRLSTLKIHRLLHEDKKPHQCNVCGKCFTQVGHLRKHNLVHKNKKPHQC